MLSELHRIKDRAFIISSKKKIKIENLKKVLLIIPAFNEETCILRTLESVNKLLYPKNKLRIMVVDDGSTDNTVEVVKTYLHKNKLNFPIKIISKQNGGKADALNLGIKSTNFGELIMCLDADSKIHKLALLKLHKYFLKDNIVGAACNVGFETKATSLIGLSQKFEFMMGNYTKRVHNYLNMEFIIGGIGSTYRRSLLEEINLYPTNTMVEDMALSVKILNLIGNKEYRIINAFDAITYSQAVSSFKDLIKQRYRWKYGGMQVLYLNKKLIFSKSKTNSKWLTHLSLPSVFTWYLQSLLEPFIIIASTFYLIIHKDFSGLLAASLLTAVLSLVSAVSSGRFNLFETFVILLLSPFSIFLIMIISAAESIALYKSIFNIHDLKKSTRKELTSWISPKRV